MFAVKDKVVLSRVDATHVKMGFQIFYFVLKKESNLFFN